MKNLNFPITTSLLNSELLNSKLTIETLPDPEYPDETFIKIQFFTHDLLILPIFIQETLGQFNKDHDFEINPNIYYNCDDQNYLITTEIYQY